IWTGSNVLKNATGYNITQLIVGSEGTLGIVTKIVLRLIPHPKFDLLMLAPFNSLEKASEAVSAIFRAGITPSAMELMEIDSIILSSKMCESTAIPITENLAAHSVFLEGTSGHLDQPMPCILIQGFESRESGLRC
ncbi:MAG: FAD-binding oxidoreductase, partial [Gammaproteobacteria bacterium]|nr:FAD-binding oxidoreductase [Gammaproteobacteria bacterium]